MAQLVDFKKVIPTLKFGAIAVKGTVYYSDDGRAYLGDLKFPAGSKMATPAVDSRGLKLREFFLVEDEKALRRQVASMLSQEPPEQVIAAFAGNEVLP